MPLRSIRAGLRLRLLLALLLLGASGAPARNAYESYKGWQVRELRIEGLEASLAAELRRGLALTPTGRRPRRARAAFFPDILEQDLARARLFLARRGHPRARVAARLVPDLPKRRLDLVLDIDPGMPVLVSAVELENLDRERSLPPAGLPAAGSRFSEPAAEAFRGAVEEDLRRQGHARAQVFLTLAPVDSASVRLVYRAEPGPRFRFGAFTVDGVPGDLALLARRRADLPEGAFYDPALVADAEESLRLLDLFRQVRIVEADADESRLDLRAELKERRPRTTEFSLGYWSDDLLRVRFLWIHRNLFHHGRSLQFTASHSLFARQASLRSGWPALFWPRNTGLVHLGLLQRLEDGFDSTESSARMGLSRKRSISSSWNLDLGVSDLRITRKTDEGQPGVRETSLLSSVSLQFQEEDTDDRMQPTRGGQIWARLEVSLPGRLSDHHSVSLQGSFSRYGTLLPSVVLAMRFGGGISVPLGDTENLLPTQRLFAGGIGSMRGFRRHRLGPRDAWGHPLGGEAMLVCGGEIRFPIFRRLRGALFMDLGQVWDRIEDIDPASIQTAWGPGLMVQTPLGPVRADLGIRSGRTLDEEPRQVFHLSVGNSF